jgi:hypothetical protein
MFAGNSELQTVSESSFARWYVSIPKITVLEGLGMETFGKLRDLLV